MQWPLQSDGQRSLDGWEAQGFLRPAAGRGHQPQRRPLCLPVAALAGISDKKTYARLIRLTDSGESLADYKASKGQERRAAKERRSLYKDSGEGGSGNALQTGVVLAEDGALGVNGQDNDLPGGSGSKKGKKAGTKGKEKADSWEADVIMPPACECGGAQHATFECPLCSTCCDCDLWALSACGHHYCVQCLVWAIKVSVSDAKLFQCVTCVEEGTANGITETDVELLCQGQFREKALHEVLRDYVLKQEGGVVCGGCGEANLVSDVTEWDDLRCLACGGYMMGSGLSRRLRTRPLERGKARTSMPRVLPAMRWCRRRPGATICRAGVECISVTAAQKS
jgi:hypothetical protein